MDVLMPQLGETVNEGTIAAWHKKAGDSVQKGDVLLDVETDKVSTDIESPASGVLSSIEVPEGDTVDVGTVLAVLTVEGEVAETKSDAPVAPPTQEKQIVDTPSDRTPPKKSRGDRLSPAVRRLLHAHSLDANQMMGSGRDGRLTKRDVTAFIDAGGGAKVAPSSLPSSAGSERIPFDRIRKVTAAHMVRSKATSPHVLQTIDIDFHGVDIDRGARKAQWKADNGYSLSYLPYVARAVCMSLADFPRINASIDGEALIVHPKINLAIAIDLNHEGLVAAVARDAGPMRVSALAEKFNDLVSRAKSNRLKPDDLQGGTYTLSNPGPFGTLFTAPIINQPQVGILSMDAIKKRAHVIESAAGDSLGIRPVGILAHSFDHRAIDGAYSGAYLQRLKTVIETTDWKTEWY